MEPASGDCTRHEAGNPETQATPASEAAPETGSMDGTKPAGRGGAEAATEAGSEAKPSTEPEAKTSTEPGTATEAEAAREAGAAGEEAGAEPATATKPATKAGTARPRSLRERLRERLQRRRRALSRRLEYRRLRRLRKLTVPAYTHCKNCGERLQGMYCHRCGQYALDIEQPFWKYIKQYFENVYQFDSKVWQTLWLLFRRPGFLTTEFNAGKINSYVHPFRLYMFISVVFFTLFFMVASSTAEQQLRHERYRTSRLPKGVVEALHTGRGGADTCVYLYDGAGLAEMLDFNDLRSDSLLRITPLDSRHGVARVELPRMLFDSCLRVTTLAEQDRINLEGAREVLGKAAEEAAGSESGAENGDGGEAGAKAGADADVVPESGSGDGAESGHGAGITAGAGTAASAGGVPGSEAGIKADAEEAALDKAMASIKGVDVDEEELAVIGALLAFDPGRTTVYAWQPPPKPERTAGADEPADAAQQPAGAALEVDAPLHDVPAAALRAAARPGLPSLPDELHAALRPRHPHQLLLPHSALGAGLPADLRARTREHPVVPERRGEGLLRAGLPLHAPLVTPGLRTGMVADPLQDGVGLRALHAAGRAHRRRTAALAGLLLQRRVLTQLL